MGFFYFDDSLHSRGRFSLGAFVYSECPLENPVVAALCASGLKPGVDEFKSGARMDLHPEQAMARSSLMAIFRSHCRVGIVIAPDSPREVLGDEALCGLRAILANPFRGDTHEIFFDEGIFQNRQVATRKVSSKPEFSKCRFHFEQNSIQVKGIQVADLLAHCCSIMLLAELGLVKKTVRLGATFGLEPDTEVDLEYEMNTLLRNHFFMSPLPRVPRPEREFWVDVYPWGLHVAPSCLGSVRNAAMSRFGKVFLGCIL